MNTHRYIALALSAAVLAGCGTATIQDITAPPPASAVMFFNFGVNAPGVNFYANDTKLTAIGSTSGTQSTIGTKYGQVAAGGNYVGIAPGQYTLAGEIPDTVGGTPISKVNTAIASGKHYTYYQSGLYDPTAKTVDAFVVEDAIPAQFDYSVAYVRFVNAIYNANPMTLYATGTDTVTGGSSGKVTTVGGAVPYKSAGAYMALPPGTYDLATRYSGASTNAITRTSVGFIAGRVYTVTAVGDITVTSSKAAAYPYLDNTPNR